jgi:threonine dehydrogenase-like Zn-dependent dehydrogenase
MKALQITAPLQATMIDIDEPQAQTGEVVVKIEAIASCPQWDITMFTGHDIFERPDYPKYPTVPGQPGHEMAGVVESLGAGVQDFAVGDPVVVWCTMGDVKQGYYAEKAAVPTKDLLHRPAHISADDAASFEMAMCVASCFLTLPDLRNERVSIGGLGPAGLIAVQMAKAAGAKEVVGFDLKPERCKLACALGADRALLPTDTAASKIRTDYGIDCSGHRASVQFQMDIVEKGLSLFGVPHEPYTYEQRHWNLTLYGYKGHSLEAAQYAMRLLEAGKLNFKALHSVELPLTQFSEGTRMLMEQKAIKILYRP